MLGVVTLQYMPRKRHTKTRSCAFALICLDCGSGEKTQASSLSETTVSTSTTQGYISTTSPTETAATSASTEPSLTDEATLGDTSCQTNCSSTEPCSTSCDVPCSLLMQDCPEGAKCAPGPGEYGTWSSELCVPLPANPKQIGEACQVVGSFDSGEDDCDEGLLCWVLGGPDETSGVGTCFEMCTFPDAACADSFATCVTPIDSPVSLCMPICNPSVPNCPAGEHCIFFVERPVPAMCEKEPIPGGPPFSPCANSYQCDPLLTCHFSSQMKCDQDSACCLQICSVSQQNCDAGSCNPLYPPDTAEFGLDDVGICG